MDVFSNIGLNHYLNLKGFKQKNESLQILKFKNIFVNLDYRDLYPCSINPMNIFPDGVNLNDSLTREQVHDLYYTYITNKHNRERFNDSILNNTISGDITRI